MKKAIVYILILIAGTTSIFSQSGFTNDRSSYYTFGTQFFAEAHIMPYHSRDSVRIIVFYKIMNDILSFKQIKEDERYNQYLAIPTIEAIIKDETGIIREHDNRRDSVFVESYEMTNSKTDYTSGYMEEDLATGNYTGLVKAYDRYSEKIEEETLEFDANINFFDRESISHPIFATMPAKNTYHPLNIGGNISFKENDIKMIIPVSYKKDYDTYNYIIQKYPAEQTGDWEREVSISGRAEMALFNDFSISQSENTIEMKFFENAYNIESNYQPGFLSVDLPDNAFVPGSYRIRIFREASPDTATFEFRCIWENMPLSLNNVDYAVDMMYYILTEEEHEEMEDGNTNEKFKKLLDYWKNLDPTPQTPYNEAMEIYFDRVDYAFFNYQTIAAPDGAKTDRGKIFVLFGPPDRITNTLSEGTSYEIWKYKQQDKTFTFEVTDPGVFELVKIEDGKDSQ